MVIINYTGDSAETAAEFRNGNREGLVEHGDESTTDHGS